MNSLKDIINNALTSSGESMKRASARDAAPTGANLDFLEQILPSSKAKVAAEVAKPVEAAKVASHNDVMDDASYAMKLATALQIGSGIVQEKLAHSPLDAPGPAVTASGNMGAPTHPTASSTVTGKITGPTTGPGGLATTKDDFTTTDAGGGVVNHPGKTAGWTQNPESVRRVINAKIAQAEVFASMGDTAAAEKLLAEVKLAQDPSSPQPSLPAHNASFKLDTERSQSGNRIPDNAGLIALTRASARDATTREMGAIITEPAKKDPAVQAALGRSDGLKISSREFLINTIKTAQDPNASDEARQKAAGIIQAFQARLSA